ncbi:MAG: hypothetical protein RL266_2054 [Bacteroidota bacterium]|jgi:hypothetical protein
MKIKLMLALLSFVFTNTTAQIKEFFINCDPADFQFIYDNYEQDIYIPATFEYDGTTWSNVSIRIRGDGSRQFPKKSLKVRFNEGAYIDGRTNLNINAEWEDQSYIQQSIASRLMRESGQACFTTEHVRIYLNGSYFGLYLMVEAVDERFFEIRDLDPNGNTYKASLDGSSLSIFDQPQYHWEQETGANLNMLDLQQLINAINDEPQATYGNLVNDLFNRSEVVNLISMNVLLSLGSTYYHNYFMHHEPAQDKWMMLPWDMDKTLSYYGSNFPYHRSSTIWMPDNPYHEKAIHDNGILNEIRSRIIVLDASIYNLTFLNPIIDSLQAVIAVSVQEDLTDDVADTLQWQTKVNDYRNILSQRANNALNQIDEYPRNFTIERIGVAEPNSNVTVHWTPSESPVQRPISYKFFFGSDLDLENTASIVQSNITDTLFSFSTPTTEGLYYYKVQAYDGFTYVDGFDTYNPIVVTSNVPELVINEINYNSSLDHPTEDWVEIHNPLSYAVNLEGWLLKDDQNDHVFEFGAAAHINPGQFVIVARDTTTFNALVTTTADVYGVPTFGFGNSGDVIRLYHSSGVLVDEVNYSDTLPWPFLADGYGPTLELLSPELDNSDPANWAAWESRTGTPGSANFTGTGIRESEELLTLTLYPNPVNGNSFELAIGSPRNASANLEILDLTGRLVYRQGLALRAGSNVQTIHHEIESQGTYLLLLKTTGLTYASRFVLTGNKH